MLILGIFVVIIVLFGFSIVLGLPWIDKNPRVVFPVGFFFELLIFQLLVFPFALLRLSLTLLSVIYIIVLVLLCAFILKRKFYKKIDKISIGKISVFECVYFAIFLLLLTYQIYGAIKYDFTVNSYDDNWYVTWANDAAETGQMYTINSNTGLAQPLNVHRAMQSFIMFPAFLSVITHIPVIVIEHIILQVYFLILAYSIYDYMASVICEKREDRFIFLVFLSLIYIFGSYSHYSTSFRLLGPNYQGKAVLAVSLTPLVFTLLLDRLNNEYENKTGLLLLCLSIAAVACSLIGTVTIIINVAIPVLINQFSKERKPKQLLYIVWTSIIPIIYITIYCFDRFFVL